MYGYGDEPEPLPETVDLVEEIVIDYATGLMHAAMDGAAARGRLKSGATRGSAVGPEDVMFLVRKVRPTAHARVHHAMQCSRRSQTLLHVCIQHLACMHLLHSCMCASSCC